MIHHDHAGAYFVSDLPPTAGKTNPKIPKPAAVTPFLKPFFLYLKILPQNSTINPKITNFTTLLITPKPLKCETPHKAKLPKFETSCEGFAPATAQKKPRFGFEKGRQITLPSSRSGFADPERLLVFSLPHACGF